jgi:predicted transcriptional regulator
MRPTGNIDYFKGNFSVRKGFLTVIESSQSRCKTTDKGKELLARLNEIHEIL